ncbi:MAG: fimbrillin family protein [Bacteroidales bacterium]|nr:fimbrillin family protein [Bacteroidales bacterium]
MKKFFLLGIIAFAALSVTSCTKDEVIEIMPQEAIEFGTYLGHDVQSRGVVLDNSNFNQFGVFASYTDGEWNANSPINFMFNQVVNKSGNNWTYSPLKYWPADQSYKVSFFAYAPYAASDNGISLVTEKTGAGAPQILYTINDSNLGKMADFVADVQINHSKDENIESGIDQVDENVTFSLKHELTRVNILAKLDRDAFGPNDVANKTKVNIKSVEFTGSKDLFASKGTYTFATENDKRGTWQTTPTQDGDTINLASILNAQVDTYLSPYTISGVSVGTTTAVPLFKNAEYLFLIPVAGETGLATAGDVKMKIAYDIVTVDSAVYSGYTATPAVKEISLPVGALKQGWAYLYTLTFGLNEIVLSAEVSDWSTAGPEEDVDWDDVDFIQQ